MEVNDTMGAGIKKWWIRSVCILTSALLVAGLLGSCDSFSASRVVNEQVQNENIDTDFNTNLKNTMGYTLIAENSELQMYIKGVSCELKIVDKKNGAVWYSNPQDRFLNDSPQTIGSQMDIQYSVNNNLSSYDSYSDAISADQFSYEKITNGIRVNFLFGQKPVVYIVPQILSTERGAYFYSKMDSDGKALFNQFYSLTTLNNIQDAGQRAIIKSVFPILAHKTCYVVPVNDSVRNGGYFASDYLMTELQDAFKKAGYTKQDLERDNTENKQTIKAAQDLSINASIEYTLDGGALLARVPRNSVSFDRDYLQLTKITILPYFGADDANKDGYMVVPDGTGAIINFKNSSNNYGFFDAKVYGNNRTITDMQKSDTPQAYMPVFGIRSGKDSFLGIIENGDADTDIYACEASSVNKYNVVNAQVAVTDYGSTTQSPMSVYAGVVYEKSILNNDIQIRYLFQSGDEANYTGMALQYQKYLIQKGILKRNNHLTNVPMSLTTIGAVIQKKAIAGIPMNVPMALTTYKNTEDIARSLKSRGIRNLNIQLENWCDNANMNTVFNKVDLIRELGGSQGFRNLIQYAKSNQINLFPEANFLYVNKAGLLGGFNYKHQSSRQIDNTIACNYTYDMATGEQNQDAFSYIVSPQIYSGLINGYARSLTSYNLWNIDVSNMGNELNSDYNEKKQIDRQQAEKIVGQQISTLAGRGYQVEIDGGNFYALKGVSFINNAPIRSNNSYICDQSIPFYQIVLHGFVQYASSSLNLSSDMNQSFLNCIETGTIPSFSWIYQTNDALMETDNDYFSLSYKSWFEQAVSYASKFQSAFENCYDATITNYEMMTDQVIRITYSNGTDIYVNYGSTPYHAARITVEPHDYAVERG